MTSLNIISSICSIISAIIAYLQYRKAKNASIAAINAKNQIASNKAILDLNSLLKDVSGLELLLKKRLGKRELDTRGANPSQILTTLEEFISSLNKNRVFVTGSARSDLDEEYNKLVEYSKLIRNSQIDSQVFENLSQSVRSIIYIVNTEIGAKSFFQ